MWLLVVSSLAGLAFLIVVILAQQSQPLTVPVWGVDQFAVTYRPTEALTPRQIVGLLSAMSGGGRATEISDRSVATPEDLRALLRSWECHPEDLGMTGL